MIWGQIVLKAFTNLVLMLVFLVPDLGVWLEMVVVVLYVVVLRGSPGLASPV